VGGVGLDCGVGEAAGGVEVGTSAVSSSSSEAAAIAKATIATRVIAARPASTVRFMVPPQ
jgi:hypothetical protein